MDEEITFCIGHHESKRIVPITANAVQLAHAANYDMITVPVTTPHFHSRILASLSSSLSELSATRLASSAGLSVARPLNASPLSRLDSNLTPHESMSQIVALSSSWIDLCSPDPLIADISRQILCLEVAYAAFCGVGYVLVPGPRLRRSTLNGGGLATYARAILDALSRGPYIQIQIWMPIIDHPSNYAEQNGDLAPFARPSMVPQEDDEEQRRIDLFGTWAAWDYIRSICKYHSRLCVALSLPHLLPPVPIQCRWFSEPIRLLSFTADSFTKNPKGYPVLSQAHQAFLTRFMRLRTKPWLLLCDVGPLPGQIRVSKPDVVGNAVPNVVPSEFPTPAEAFSGSAFPDTRPKDDTPHLSYLRHLQCKQPQATPLERFGAGYQDYLQAPLRPLTIDLESITYEVFEKDPIKYDWYEKAIARALHDWVEQAKPPSNPEGRVVIAVVGAGRGPLVTRALRACEGVGVEIDMWALEKNPNAFVLLQRHNEQLWNKRVNLVHSDMRTWRGPVRHASHPIPPQDRDGPIENMRSAVSYTGDVEVDRDYLLATATAVPTHYRVDILVSELLGSFADNELSPECLDGVQHLLNPTHGISIPSSYTAHVTPIAAPKLHADISAQLSSNIAASETPFVVMLHAIDYLSTTVPLEDIESPASPTSPGATTQSRRASGSTLSPQPLVQTAWGFCHPNVHLPHPATTSNSHNCRKCTLHFPVREKSVCHGLAGYFETVLYGKFELSTNPVTMDEKSAGMISWFPIYFPLKAPLYVPAGGELVVSMWRRTDDRKVWYEWMVDAYARDGGKKATRKFRVGGSELHSSIKDACFM